MIVQWFGDNGYIIKYPINKYRANVTFQPKTYLIICGRLHRSLH